MLEFAKGLNEDIIRAISLLRKKEPLNPEEKEWLAKFLEELAKDMEDFIRFLKQYV